jgi:hypothetical protein
LCIQIAAAQNLSQNLPAIGVNVPDFSALNKGQVPGQKYTQDYLGVSDFGVPAELLDLFYLVAAIMGVVVVYFLFKGVVRCCCCRSRSTGKHE